MTEGVSSITASVSQGLGAPEGRCQKSLPDSEGATKQGKGAYSILCKLPLSPHIERLVIAQT